MLSLTTPLLLLRDFTPADFETFYTTTEDPEYRRYYPEDEMTLDHWQRIFERTLASTTAEPRTQFQLAICLPGSEADQHSALIGTCGVRIEDVKHQQASFGCAIARPYWGAGYAYEASYALIDYGFSNLPIERIFAETIVENSRARALAERLGMRLEEESRQAKFFHGRWWDGVVYAVLKDEWSRS